MNSIDKKVESYRHELEAVKANQNVSSFTDAKIRQNDSLRESVKSMLNHINGTQLHRAYDFIYRIYIKN